MTSGAGQRGAERYYGSYPRSIRFANHVLGLGSAVFVSMLALRGLNRNIDWFLPFFALIPAWGAFMRLDRRVYLVVSTEGIWCRAWGNQLHSFSEFKAVYPRQNRLQRGVAFIPRSPTEFARSLSWLARHSFRTGDGFSAHTGTLTLWATRVGLNRDSLLRALQAEIRKAQEDGRAAEVGRSS